MKRELALGTDQSCEARPYGNVGPGLSYLPFYLGQKFWIFLCELFHFANVGK